MKNRQKEKKKVIDPDSEEEQIKKDPAESNSAQTSKVRAQTSVLTRSAIALALCMVSLLLFRGATSIVSTFIIPVVIVIFSKRKESASFIYISAGLLMMTALFFQTQIIFVIGYLLLSLVLKNFFLDSTMKMKVSLSGIVKYLISVIVVLFIGIQLSQIIFLIPLHDMMLRISGNNPLGYLGILLLEGIVIILIHLLILKAFTSRVKVK